MDARVVLVEPENPLNVGFVARAMRSFGVTDLVVAGPWPSMPAEAYVTGVSAPDILRKAKLVPSLADALRGCDTAVAFSRRPTILRQREFVLPAAPPLAGKAALVFGRESSGLTRAESALCPNLARIPCRDGISLNLGQAVSVALFALSSPAGEAKAARGPGPAPLDRLLSLWDFLEPRLASAPRFTKARRERVRQMLYRLSPADDDFSLLFAVMKELAK